MRSPGKGIFFIYATDIAYDEETGTARLSASGLMASGWRFERGRGSLTRGMTVVDWHGLWGRAPNADVAIEIDDPRFLDEVVDRIAALTRRAA